MSKVEKDGAVDRAVSDEVLREMAQHMVRAASISVECVKAKDCRDAGAPFPVPCTEADLARLDELVVQHAQKMVADMVAEKAQTSEAADTQEDHVAKTTRALFTVQCGPISDNPTPGIGYWCKMAWGIGEDNAPPVSLTVKEGTTVEQVQRALCLFSQEYFQGSEDRVIERFCERCGHDHSTSDPDYSPF